MLFSRWIPLGAVGGLVDPAQVDQEQAPRRLGCRLDAVEVNLFLAVVGTNAHEVALFADDVNQLVLLE